MVLSCKEPLIEPNCDQASCRASLEEKRKAVYALTIAHLVFSILSALGTISTSGSSGFGVLLMALPVTITYTIFYQWIMSSLASTKECLALRKQTTKLYMYRQMTFALYTLFIIAALIMFLSIFIIFGQRNTLEWRASHWKSIWFFSSGWPMLLNLIGTVVICWIFRPRAHNQNYGLNELADYTLSEDDLDGRADVALQTLRSKRMVDGSLSDAFGSDDHHGRWATEGLGAISGRNSVGHSDESEADLTQNLK